MNFMEFKNSSDVHSPFAAFDARSVPNLRSNEGERNNPAGVIKLGAPTRKFHENRR